MKIEEAYKQVLDQQIEEGIVKNAIAATSLAAATLMAPSNLSDENPANRVTPSLTFNAEKSTANIADRYKISHEKAKTIVDLAVKHAKHPFPQAHHILGTIGVESSFNEKAVSNLKHDPAVGLMQIRPKVTGTSKKELSSMEGQIKHGSDMLHQLYKKTGDQDKAIQAYNIGLTSYNKGKRAMSYLNKTKKETSLHLHQD